MSLFRNLASMHSLSLDGSTIKLAPNREVSSTPTLSHTLNASVATRLRISRDIKSGNFLHETLWGNCFHDGESEEYLDHLCTPVNGWENSRKCTLSRIQLQTRSGRTSSLALTFWWMSPTEKLSGSLNLKETRTTKHTRTTRHARRKHVPRINCLCHPLLIGTRLYPPKLLSVSAWFP